MHHMMVDIHELREMARQALKPRLEDEESIEAWAHRLALEVANADD